MIAWTWIFAQAPLQALIAAYPSVFSTGTIIYENIGATGAADTVTNATVHPYQSWDSYAAFVAGPLNANADGFLYDYESWTNTPTDEQQSPAAYSRLFAQHVAAQAGNKFCILAPGDDLATELHAETLIPYSYVYLEFGKQMGQALQFSTAAPSYPHISHIQSQSKLPGYTQGGYTITTMAPFGGFLSTIQHQARQTAPTGSLVTCGITLNTTVSTAPPLISAVQMARDYGSDGCWFNVPGSTFTATQLSIMYQVIQAAQT